MMEWPLDKVFLCAKVEVICHAKHFKMVGMNRVQLQTKSLVMPQIQILFLQIAQWSSDMGPSVVMCGRVHWLPS